MKSKTIIITGASGQTASYLADILSNNHNDLVISLNRKSVDLTDAKMVRSVIERWKPDYVLNFAANSSTANCEQLPMLDVLSVNTLIVANLLDAIKTYVPNCRFLNAGSEQELHLDNAYGISKSLAFKIVNFYKRKHNIFAIQPILYNHTSYRQKPYFFLPKIIREAIRIEREIKNNQRITPIIIGNIDILSSWAFAGDIAEMCWKNINLDKPLDLYLAGNEVFNGERLISMVFDALSINHHIDSNGFYFTDGQALTQKNQELIRSNEKNRVCNSESLRMAYNVLDWTPKHDMISTISEMVAYAKDIQILTSITGLEAKSSEELLTVTLNKF